jgi:hypothetical protein
LLAYRPLDAIEDMLCRGDICDRGSVYNDVDHDADKGMFLYVERPGIQGESVAKRGNAIFWKSPLHELAEWERYELNEKDGDIDIWNYRELEYRMSE